MTRTITNLLPCPFCGGEAEVYEMQYGADGQYSVFGVFCVDDSNSELIGLSKYQHGHFIDNFPTEAEAIAAWNSRAERTCKPTEEYCCQCGQDLVLCDMGIGPNGGAVELDPPILFNYCPTCGARVVGRDGE